MTINKELFNELKNRFVLDQRLSNKQDWKKLEKVYHDNSLWLKSIILKEGRIIKEKVNEKGELYTWLIIQHSDDLDFQKYYLELLIKLPYSKDRVQYIAYLTDRILVKENKEQIYGTQFSNGNHFPIKDIKNLDKRRKEMGLESFENYYKLMNKRYS